MGIKRVKLNYKPIMKRRSDEIAFKVSHAHVNAVNKSIDQKIKRNAIERQESYLKANDYIVGEDTRKILKKI